MDAGEDGNPAFGALLSYTDNGDGTVTDDNTKLVWEKKSDDGRVEIAGAFPLGRVVESSLLAAN